MGGGPGKLLSLRRHLMQLAQDPPVPDTGTGLGGEAVGQESVSSRGAPQCLLGSWPSFQRPGCAAWFKSRGWRL